MIYGMYLSTMGAMVQSGRHGVITNNLANSTTAGFKPDWSIYRKVPAESLLSGEHRSEVDALLEKTGGGVWMDKTISNFRPGAFRQTGNPLDLALHDKSSFFAIRQNEGAETRYTRDGHFTLNEAGQLVTTDGAEVLGTGGDPIFVDPGVEVSVREDGMLMDVQNNVEIAQIGVWQADNVLSMTKIGNNLFDPKDAQLTAAQSGVAGGVIEESATEPINEMANMIEAHRAYEANMTFLKMQDESLGEAVTRLGRTA